VGAITNGNADVHYIGIGHYFDFVITAAGAGVAKPKAEIFHAALDAAGVQACHAVHVGDDPERDVQGANAVGMRSVWVNVKAAPWPGGRPPDAEIRTLDELQPLLERWHDQ
jgi:putative hydrolase of the HAD superfamily